MQMDLRKVASVLVCSPRSRGERDSEIPGTLKRGEEHDVPISNRPGGSSQSSAISFSAKLPERYRRKTDGSRGVENPVDAVLHQERALGEVVKQYEEQVRA